MSICCMLSRSQIPTTFRSYGMGMGDERKVRAGRGRSCFALFDNTIQTHQFKCSQRHNHNHHHSDGNIELNHILSSSKRY